MQISTRRFLRRTYAEDMQIFPYFFHKVLLVILLAFLFFVLPHSLSSYPLYIVNIAAINIIAVIGLNILIGNTGLISLGHMAFVAIGSYTTVKLMPLIGFWGALPISAIFTGLVGLVIALPSLRIRGLYLAMASLAFQFIMEFVFSHWTSVTGGYSGIAVGPVKLGSFTFKTDVQFYYLILIFLIIAVFAGTNITRSKLGRAFGAVRDRDIAANIIGINVFAYKVRSFFISSVFAGVAGSLYAAYLGYITPENFGILYSIQLLTMVIVGGMGSVLGSIFGAVFMTILPEIIRLGSDTMAVSYPALVQRFVDVKTIIFGTIIVGFLMFAPDGILGFWRDIKNYFREWPFSY